MGKEIDSIGAIIGNRCVKSPAWNVETIDPCKDLQNNSSGSQKQCEQNLSFQVTARYKSVRNGAELNFYGPRKGLLGFFQPTAVHYFATIDGRKIYLLDNNADTSSAAMLDNNAISETPDGKITPHDLLNINGFAYRLIETDAPGIFAFTDEFNDRAKYNGLQFKRVGDQWVFEGPKSREIAGKELETLLKDIAKQYSLTLSEAKNDAK